MDHFKGLILTKNSPLVEMIFDNAERLRKGAEFSELHNILLLSEVGSMSSVWNAGVMAELEKLGLSLVYPIMIGNSGGMPPVLFAPSRTCHAGWRIFHEDLSGGRFISNGRFSVPRLRLGHLMEIFKNGDGFNGAKRIDVEAVINSPIKVFTGVTRVRDGKRIIVDPKEVGVMRALEASMNIPVIAGTPPVKMGEEGFMDGLALPLADIVERFQPDGVVLINNRPPHRLESLPGVKEKFLTNLLLREFPAEFVKTFLGRYEARNENVRTLYRLSQKIPVGIICPDEVLPVSRFEDNRNLLRKSAEMGMEKVLRIFGDVGKQTGV